MIDAFSGFQCEYDLTTGYKVLQNTFFKLTRHVGKSKMGEKCSVHVVGFLLFEIQAVKFLNFLHSISLKSYDFSQMWNVGYVLGFTSYDVSNSCKNEKAMSI